MEQFFRNELFSGRDCGKQLLRVGRTVRRRDEDLDQRLYLRRFGELRAKRQPHRIKRLESVRRKFLWAKRRRYRITGGDGRQYSRSDFLSGNDAGYRRELGNLAIARDQRRMGRKPGQKLERKRFRQRISQRDRFDGSLADVGKRSQRFGELGRQSQRVEIDFADRLLQRQHIPFHRAELGSYRIERNGLVSVPQRGKNARTGNGYQRHHFKRSCDQYGYRSVDRIRQELSVA